MSRGLARSWHLPFDQLKDRSRRAIPVVFVLVWCVIGGSAQAECRFIPEKSFVIMGKLIYSSSVPYGISAGQEDVWRRSKSLEAALYQYKSTTRRARLFGLVDLLDFETAAGEVKTKPGGVTFPGFLRDIDFAYEVTPALDLKTVGEASADFTVTVTAAVIKHALSESACKENSILCAAEAAGTPSRSAVTRALRPDLVSHPASEVAEIISSPKPMPFSYRIHVHQAQPISLSGCTVKYSQVDIVEASDSKRRESRFVLWGWLASAERLDDLKAASLVGMDRYWPIYGDLLQ